MRPHFGSWPLVLFGSLTAATAAGSHVVAVSPSNEPQSAQFAHFDGSSPTNLSNDPVIVHLLNDTDTPLEVRGVSATLTPSSEGSSSTSTSLAQGPANPIDVLVEVSIPDRVSTSPTSTADAAPTETSPAVIESVFEVVGDDGFIVPAAGVASLRLTLPQPSPSSGDGWLTVVIEPQGVVLRKQLIVGATVPAAAVAEWATTVERKWPWGSFDGEVGEPLPLATTCPRTPPAAVVIANDSSVEVTSECQADGDLQLKVTGLTELGTYKGALEIGTKTVTVQIRHTLLWWWAAGAIAVGLLIALWTQGMADHGWTFQQPSWLRKLEKRAQETDFAYDEKSSGFPWEAYRITPASLAESSRLKAKLDGIVKSRPRLARWLPWPEDFMKRERADLRDGIAKLAEFVEAWPEMPQVFAKVSNSLHSAPERYGRLAPKFALRTTELLVGKPDLSFDELSARRDEATAASEVFLTVDQLDLVKAFLAEFDRPDAVELPDPGDRETIGRARRLVRQAEASLRELGDATKITSEVAPVVQKAARIASQLPIRVVVLTAPPLREGVAQETAAEPNILNLPLLAAHWFSRTFSAHRFALGQLSLIAVTAMIGIWSGLALLYVDKAWGTFADFASAVAWGFAATTVVTPIVNAIRQLGARPTDSNPESAKAEAA